MEYKEVLGAEFSIHCV